MKESPGRRNIGVLHRSNSQIKPDGGGPKESGALDYLLIRELPE